MSKKLDTGKAKINSNGVDPYDANPFNVFEDVEKATEGGKKRLSIERIYQKKTQLEHILLRPDTYIGSVEAVTQPMWIYDALEERMVSREITFVPGLYKIFDEIIVNAADNKQRDKNMTCIKINIDPDKNEISVWNNGKGIPVVEHQVEKMFVPEMIFGTLLTSSNYDDSERKVTGGRNGYGAKLCNIFSTKFTVETSSRDYKRSFKQTWTDNMNKTEKAKTGPAAEDDFTRVTFTPDLAKFKMDKLDKDIVALMSRRAYDLAGSSRGVKVYLNGKKLPIQGFKQYIELYTSKLKDDKDEQLKLVYEQVNERWEVAVTVSDRGFQQVSFVNSIATTKGGRHVDYVGEQIVDKVIEKVKKDIKKTGMQIRPFQVKNHMWVFVNCLIENPTFDSQTKENMTLQAKSFGSKCQMSEKFMGQVVKSGVVESVLQWVQFKQQTQLDKQCHTKKHSKLTGIKKLEDANDAGTKRSTQCTLILTEGDSAKSMTVGGLAVVGRDTYGIFPLRGKLLNVREASHKQIMENNEINSLVKILGLQYKKKYGTPEDMQTLRYGKIMIMTDQDHDGSHIKGLVINFIHHNWPSLLRQNFVEEFITPIVKVSKGQQKHSFFSIPEYEEWKTNTNNWHTWTIKYYKGLGTSDSKEAKEYFSDMQRHRIRFKYSGDSDDTAIELAFNKKKADERKEWLNGFMEDRKQRRINGQPEVYLYEKNTTSVTYTDFVNKELVLFSNLDNERSIPNLVDGFKPGQRKVLFTCFKRNDKREVKVAQLAGSVAEKSAYHHGEQSLMGTIINLAQNYVGSNNLNLLMPNGQFGTRLLGGKDAASPRYIFTMLSPVARALFPPDDFCCLKYLRDDNKRIEPEWYCPVIPMLLVNGADGIGTGYATTIPCFNPREIVRNLRRMLDNDDPVTMTPWYKGFRGEIVPLGSQRYLVSGEVGIIDDTTLEITELPVGTWTQTYKESVLEALATGTDKQPAMIQEYKDYTTESTVRFVVKMTPQQMASAEQKGYHVFFKLQTTICCLKRYASVDEMLKDYFNVRMKMYEKRKDYLQGLLDAEARQLSNKARFILENIDGILKIHNQKKKIIVDQLVTRKYEPDPVKRWKEERKKLENADSDEEEETETTPADEENTKDGGDRRLADYDYLLSMKILTFSEEEKDKLLKQRDAKKIELEALRQKTVRDLWRDDLTTFMDVLDKHEAKERDDAGPAAEVGKKATGKSGRKGAGNKFTLAETLPSAHATRVVPSIDKEMVIRLEKQDKAKTTKATGGGAGKRGRQAKKDKLENGENGEDDLENSSLFERISKKRPQAQNLKKAKPVADDKGIKRFLGKKKAKSDESSSEEDDDVELIEYDDDESVKSSKSDVELFNDDDDFLPTTTKKSAPKPKKDPAVTKNAAVLSDDEDFSSVFDVKKAPAKKNTKNPTVETKKTAVLSDDDLSAPAVKKAPKKKPNDDDDDFEPPAAKKPKSTAAAAATSKKPPPKKPKKIISDDEFELDDDKTEKSNEEKSSSPLPTKIERPKRSPAKKKPIIIDDSDEDDDDDKDDDWLE